MFDQRRFHPLGHHADALVDIGDDAAVGVEEPGVVDDDRRLPDLADEIQRLGHREGAGFLPLDDLDQHHLVDGGKEVDADELLRPFRGLRQIADRQGGGVGGKDRAFGDHRLGLRGHPGLDLHILEHRLDDQVTARKCGVIRGRGDPGQHLFLLLRRHLAALHALVEQLGGMRLAAIRGLLRGVDQHDLDPGIRADIGDARAHHAGTENADLFHPLIRHVRPVRALLQRLLVQEQGPDHGRGGRVHQHLGEPARLDPQRGVEIDHRALIDRRQQRPGRRIDALGLAMHHGVGADEGHEAGRVIGRAAGHLEALLVPGLDDIGIRRRQNPCLRLRQQLTGRHDLVNQPRALGLLRIQHLAFQEDRRRRHRADHAGIPRRAAAAGEEADKDLRQADLRLRAVGHEAAVTGQRDLCSDTCRGAGQGAGHRLAAFHGLRVHPRAFQLAQDMVAGHGEIEQRLGRVFPRLLADLRQHVQVHPARECFLARGDDDALDGVVGQRGIDHLAHLGEALAAHHVHRLARHVPGQRRNAVGVHGIGEIGHVLSPV